MPDTLNNLYFNTFGSGYFVNRSPLAIPPGNGADVVIDGQNMWHTNRNTWRKRDGLTEFSSATFGGDLAPDEHADVIFSYVDTGIVRLLVDLGGTVEEFDTNSRTALTYYGGAFTKDPTILASFVSVGSTAYIAIEGTTGYKLVSSSQDLKRWGILAPASAPTYTLTTLGGTATHDSKIGYRYVYVYKDSTDGHISSASPILTLGEATPADYSFSNKAVELTIDYSTEDRVDFVDIYRTTDGGDQFFYLTSIANNTAGGTTTYDDDNEDDQLNTALLAPMNNVNDPPANLKEVIFYSGRLWGFVDNLVYYATGPDTFNGVPEESWDPLNFFSFPIDVTGLAPTSQGLLIFTLTDTYLLRGGGKDDFSLDILRTRLGLITSRNLAIDGDTIYMVSASSELIRITDNIENIGIALTPEIISGVTQLVIHREGSLSALYAVCEQVSFTSPAGPVLAIGALYRFGLANETWSPISTFEGFKTITCLASAQVDNGVFELLFTGTDIDGLPTEIWKFTDSSASDNSVEWDASLTFGSMVLCPPGALVNFESIFIEGSNIDQGGEGGLEPTPTVSILPQEVSGAFTPLSDPQNEPPRLDTPTSLKSLKWYTSSQVPNTPGVYVPTVLRHVQIKIAYTPNISMSELYSMGINYYAA